MFNKLKQFKDLRDQAKKMQEMLGEESVTVNALGGGVVLTMDGTLQITGLAINDEYLNPAMKEKLEKGIKEAHADAMKQIQKNITLKMQQSGDLNLSNLLGSKES